MKTLLFISRAIFLIFGAIPLAILWTILGRIGVRRWDSFSLKRLLPLLLLLSCLSVGAQAAPPNKPIYVTNYVYSYFNQTNWIFTQTITLQTNFVYSTNYLTVTNYVYTFITNTAPPFNMTPWYYLTNTPLLVTNLNVAGTLVMSNAAPGMIQTLNGTTVTGHLP